jgi:hypothetical protein
MALRADTAAVREEGFLFAALGISLLFDHEGREEDLKNE